MTVCSDIFDNVNFIYLFIFAIADTIKEFSVWAWCQNGDQMWIVSSIANQISIVPKWPLFCLANFWRIMKKKDSPWIFWGCTWIMNCESLGDGWRIHNGSFEGAHELWIVNPWWGMGGGFTMGLLRVHMNYELWILGGWAQDSQWTLWVYTWIVNCESWILGVGGGGWTMDLLRMRVNCELWIANRETNKLKT